METRRAKRKRLESPLWRMLIECADMRDLVLRRLSENDAKFLNAVNRDARRMLQAAKVEVPKRFSFAALNSTSSITYAFESGLTMSEEMCNSAARAGNLELLRYLRLERGAPWSKRTCSWAALSQNVCALDWLLENDCSWSDVIFLSAVVSDSMEMVEYVCKKLEPSEEVKVSMCLRTPEAFKFGVRILQYLVSDPKVDLSYSSVDTFASYLGRWDILEYIIDSGVCPTLDLSECLEYTRAGLEDLYADKHARARKNKTSTRKWRIERLELENKLRETVRWIRERKMRSAERNVLLRIE